VKETGDGLYDERADVRLDSMLSDKFALELASGYGLVLSALDDDHFASLLVRGESLMSSLVISPVAETPAHALLARPATI
jgi:hypothetical protein